MTAFANTLNPKGDFAIETPQSNDLFFKGQGSAPFCFAFAEEQLLKDSECSTLSCRKNNASLWTSSIFEIVREHRVAEGLIAGPITAENISDLFTRGSNLILPDLEHHQSFTASECTLEHDLFLLDRLAKKDMPVLFEDLYLNYQRQGRLTPDSLAPLIAPYNLDGTIKILEDLATKSASGSDLLAKAINYRSCTQQVLTPPAAKLRQLQVENQVEAQKYIDQILSQNHSIFVSVCASNLMGWDTGWGALICGPHAIVIKSARENSYQIVDSAFFSPVPRESDGSMFVSKKTVLDAIVANLKHGSFLKDKSSIQDKQRYLNRIFTEKDDSFSIGDWVINIYPHISDLTTRAEYKTFIATLLSNKGASEEIKQLDLDHPENLFKARQILRSFLDKAPDRLQVAKEVSLRWPLGTWSTNPNRKIINQTPNVVWFEN